METSADQAQRQLVARFLKLEIGAPPAGTNITINQMTNEFIRTNLGCTIEPKKDSRANYVKNEIGEISLSAAQQHINAIMNEKPSIKKRVLNYANTIWLENVLMSYLNRKDVINRIGLKEPLPDNFLRLHRTNGGDRRNNSNFLVEKTCDIFFQKTQQNSRNGEVMDSEPSGGVCFLAILEMNYTRSTVHSVSFCDILPNNDSILSRLKDIDLPAEIDDDINFYSPENKPEATSAEIRRKIIPYFLKNNELNGNEKFDVLINNVRLKILNLSISLLKDFIIPIDRSLEGSLNGWPLVRCILDVKVGALYAMAIKEETYWVIGFNPIEKKVDKGYMFLKGLAKQIDGYPR